MASYSIYNGFTVMTVRHPFGNANLNPALSMIMAMFEKVRAINSTVERQQFDVSVFADIEDVRLSRGGDSEAYRRLVEKHQQAIGKIMWRFSRDSMVHEELVQDVFIEAYMSLGTYKEKAPFLNWLMKIATRVGYRYWKQKARQRTTEHFSMQQWDEIAVESSDVAPAEAAELVHNLLAQLPPRDRLVLTLRYLEGCDIAETAQRTGWTKAMVKVQTLRAKRKLAKLLPDEKKVFENE